MSGHQLASLDASFLADFFLAVVFGLASGSAPCTVNLYLAGNSDIAVFLAEVIQSYL